MKWIVILGLLGLSCDGFEEVAQRAGQLDHCQQEAFDLSCTELEDCHKLCILQTHQGQADCLRTLELPYLKKCLATDKKPIPVPALDMNLYPYVEEALEVKNNKEE